MLFARNFFTARFDLSRTWIALVVWSCVQSLSVLAADRAATEQVEARLIAETRAVRPGEEIHFGLQQKIIPHWHTYWRNPGDSGSPTTIQWQLPDGASASDILWPTPSRVSMGPITNYSYEHEVTLLSRVRVPADAQPGGQFAVRAVVDWLVCEEECIPQQVELDLKLPVVGQGEDTGPRDATIEAALARLPVASPWSVRVERVGSQLRLRVEFPGADAARISDVWFYPYDWGRIQQSAQQVFSATADGLELVLPVGEAPPAVDALLEGVLVITEKDTADGPATARGFAIAPTLGAAAPAGGAAPSFAMALLLAVAGGIVLNLMPCVFPVLSIKALSLVGHAGQSAAEVRRHGLVYTLGVLGSFGFLAGLLIALKAGGAQIGWGFQFQSPLFVLLVAYLMFAVGLSLSGVFYVGGSVAGAGSSLAAKPGYAGSFFTGVLATVVATPCTAPFMAAALGYALAQPAAQLLAVFLALGLGLALPYLALSYWPGLQRWLPRPGPWMERVKQGFAFPMYAAAVWLVWVLAQQAGVDAVALALGGMVLLAFAAWVYDSTRQGSVRSLRIGTTTAATVVLVALAGSYTGLQTLAAPAAKAQAAGNWRAYSESELDQLLAEGKPVFLNFTAAWCISCLVNERVALSDPAVVAAFEEGGIHYLKGDWTNRDAAISNFLARFGRSGVPLYLFYPAAATGEPVQLPQILTPDIVINAVRAPAQLSAAQP